MAISDVQSAITILRLGLRKYSEGKISPDNREVIATVDSCRENMRFIAGSLRDAYDWLSTDHAEVHERFFNFDDEGNCEEVEREQYKGTLNDGEENII